MENNIAQLQVKIDKLVKEQDELIEFLSANSPEYRKINELEEKIRDIEEEMEKSINKAFQVEIISPGKYITWYEDNIGKVYWVNDATDRENAYIIAENEPEWMEYLEKGSCKVL